MIKSKHWGSSLKNLSQENDLFFLLQRIFLLTFELRIDPIEKIFHLKEETMLYKRK